jgi:glutathione peroxidase-family protein
VSARRNFYGQQAIKVELRKFLVGKDGRVLKHMRRWTTSRPGQNVKPRWPPEPAKGVQGAV